jgi:hypothetical protein
VQPLAPQSPTAHRPDIIIRRHRPVIIRLPPVIIRRRPVRIIRLLPGRPRRRLTRRLRPAATGPSAKSGLKAPVISGDRSKFAPEHGTHLMNDTGRLSLSRPVCFSTLRVGVVTLQQSDAIADMN